MKNYSQRGFIALFSVLLISMQLLSMSLGIEVYATYLQKAVVDEIHYRQALSNAHACAELARDRITFDENRFSTGQEVYVGLSQDVTCKIVQVSVASTSATIVTEGIYSNSFVDVRYGAARENTSLPYKLTTWEKL